MFRDTYTDFSFNEIKSENFKVWITNNKDLQRSMSPNFSDKFNSPTYGQTRFHEGTTIDKQDFKLSCAAINITLNEWRAITEWLSPLKSGKLRFDWNDKYYYMVKVSKAITGSMFIKSKVDSVMGDLYIINFTVEFTTINDWAALGPYCWQEESKNDIREVNPSIYNNGYYIPQFIERMDEDASKEYKYSSSIDYHYIRSVDPYDKTTISIKDNEIKYYETYEDAQQNGDQGLLWSITGNKVDIDGTKLYSKDYSINENNLIICNPSSLNMYLEFASNGNTVINKDGITYYKFSYVPDEKVINKWIPLTIINTKNGTVTSNGIPIQSLSINDVNVYEKKDDDSFVNKGGLVIPSGRPELMKVIVKEYTTHDNNVHELKCLLNSKPIYSRENKCIVHLFDKDFMKHIDEYDKNQYSNNNKTYGLVLENTNHMVIDTPVIKYYKENDCWYLSLFFKDQEDFNNMNNGNLNLSKINTLYISICDYESLKIEVSKPIEDSLVISSWSVSGQTREVI